MSLIQIFNLIDEGKCTIGDVENLAKKQGCTLIETLENKTIYSFGGKLFGYYYHNIVIDMTRDSLIGMFRFYNKLKINSKSIIYKGEIGG